LHEWRNSFTYFPSAHIPLVSPTFFQQRKEENGKEKLNLPVYEANVYRVIILSATGLRQMNYIVKKNK
jgi:hypothetical protein